MEYSLEGKQHLNVSDIPGGVGYKEAITEEQLLNDLADESDVKIYEADEFLSTIHVPGTYSLPRTLNTLEWWKVYNQGAIGSCLGASDCQTATGVAWLKTGERIEFSKFGHYIAIQLMADLKGCRPQSLGKDQGSIPTMAIIVAAKWGYMPEVWSETIENLYVAKFGQASGLRTGQKIAPPYPRNYAEGLRSHRKYLENLRNPNSQQRKIMSLFTMDKYIRITKADQIVKAKRMGVGFVQQSSIWPKDMDAHPMRINTFSDSKDPNNRHAGGHAYQILDITPNDEFVIGNTWGQGWGGDDGAKTASTEVEQRIIDDERSIVFLKTDMPFVTTAKTAAREIPLKAADLF